MKILGSFSYFFLAMALIACIAVLMLRSLTGVLIDAQVERLMRPVHVRHDWRRDIRHCFLKTETRPLWDCIRSK